MFTINCGIPRSMHFYTVYVCVSYDYTSKPVSFRSSARILNGVRWQESTVRFVTPLCVSLPARPYTECFTT